MAPVQNTFSIIPDLPSAINGNLHGGADGSNARTNRPPMTTKQVKKAYQKANKGPKLSKAEQRRQELFEQDRIRKEFEKEKNQARARAARDKKKEKEERERAEKKKKGLPLVNVRPSQDTIARFVRAKPKSQRDDSAPPLSEDEVVSRSVSPTAHNAEKPRQFDIADKENIRPSQKRSHATPVDTNHGLYDASPTLDHAEPLEKKRRIEGEKGQMSLSIVDRVVSPSPKHDPTVSVVGERVQGTPSPDTKQSGPSVDDSFSTIDLGEENFIGDLLREMDDASSGPNALEESLAGQQQGQGPPTLPPPPELPEDLVPLPKETDRPPSYLEPAAKPTGSLPPPKLALTPKLVPDTTKTLRQHPAPEPAKHGLTPHSFAAPPRSSAQRLPPSFPGSRSFRPPTIPRAPLPGPPKLKPSNQVTTSRPSTTHFIKPPLPPPRPPPRTSIGASCHSRMARPKMVRDNEPPPSTQLFLLSHLDDFLPSPSQEAREIFEEPQASHTGNVNLSKMTATHTGNKDSRLKHCTSRVPITSCNTGFKSTPNLDSRGSHYIQQQAKHPKLSNTTVQTSLQPIPKTIPIPKPVPKLISKPVPKPTPSAFEIPFFSTQDFVLSSQDVKDIEEEPVPSPPKVHDSPPHIPPTKDPVKPRDMPRRRSPKPFLTSTCRELSYKYALERSRSAAWEGPDARRKAREELDRLQALEDERLEALLANPNDEEEANHHHGNSTSPTTAIGVEPDTGGQKEEPSAAVLFSKTPTPPQAQSQSCRAMGEGRYLKNSILPDDNTAQQKQKHNTRILPNAAPPKAKAKPRSSGSSYEAMLELLAKGPKPPKQKQKRPDAHHVATTTTTNRGTNRDEDKDRSRDATNPDQKKKASQTIMTTTTIISASQETDYDDCGVDWDDDDLFIM